MSKATAPVLTSKTTATVFDVVAYIRRKYKPMTKKHGDMTAMKLQKLVYYSQAWSLVFDDEPLFGERIEAWEHGPVVRKLFRMYRGEYNLRETLIGEGNPEELNEEQRKTIDFVVRNYGPLKPEALKKRTHREAPWKKARERAGLGPSEPSRERIRHEDMVKYYASFV